LQIEASEHARLHYGNAHWEEQNAAWLPQTAHASIARLPGSYANNLNVHNGTNQAYYAGRIDTHEVVADAPWRPAKSWSRDGDSSVAAVASVRLADPDIVLNAEVAQPQKKDVAGKHACAGEALPLWSEHQASPIVDLLHQYLQQQHEVRGVAACVCGFRVRLFCQISHAAVSARSRNEWFV
jgi:hypothetical protein